MSKTFGIKKEMVHHEENHHYFMTFVYTFDFRGVYGR